MKTYYVKVAEVYTATAKVQAENEDDARNKAEDLLAKNDVDPGEYDYTLDKEDWVVYE